MTSEFLFSLHSLVFFQGCITDRCLHPSIRIASCESTHADPSLVIGVLTHLVAFFDIRYNEEEEFASWKVRELKRIKRDTDKRAVEEAERAEVERLRNMTEEERQEALKAREKVVTNQQEKGKLKFMQKYVYSARVCGMAHFRMQRTSV
jgi:hypothetical protein